MNNQIFGLKFRQLRKQQHITLAKAAAGITSRQSLGNWEIGKGELAFEKVLLLLKKINVQPIDFLESSISSYLKQTTSQISAVYVSNQVDKLLHYATKYLDISHRNLTDRVSFLRAAVACNYYMDLTNIDLTTSSDKLRIISHFNKIMNGEEIWNFEDIYFFGNTQNLMSPRDVYNLAYSLNYYRQKHKNDNREWINAVYNTLINAEFVLIKTNIKLATDLDLLLRQKWDLPDNYAFEKIRQNFMHELLKYISTQDESAITQQLHLLELEHISDLKAGFETAYEQVKQIYFSH